MTINCLFVDGLKQRKDTLWRGSIVQQSREDFIAFRLCTNPHIHELYSYPRRLA
jgi:hypothetical protein